MCATAASRSGTTAAEMSSERYSRRVVLLGRRPPPRRTPAKAASPCTVTPASCRAATTSGRNASATSACTSSDSAALHTEGRWVLELSTIASAISRSASRVDVHVAVADPGLDHRHRRLLDHRADQAGAAARDQHVDQAAGPHQRLGRLVALPRHQLHDVGRQPGRDRGGAQHGDDRRVGATGARRAAQQHGVAALQADAGGVGGDVGPGLVDDPDHAERHPHLAQLEAVGQRRAAHHLADGVGQAGDVAQPVGHRRRPGRGRAGAGRPGARAVPAASGRGDVVGVGGEDVVAVLDERVGHRLQGGVLRRAGGERQLGGGVAGARGHLGDPCLEGPMVAHGIRLSSDCSDAGRPVLTLRRRVDAVCEPVSTSWPSPRLRWTDALDDLEPDHLPARQAGASRGARSTPAGPARRRRASTRPRPSTGSRRRTPVNRSESQERPLVGEPAQRVRTSSGSTASPATVTVTCQ